MPSPSPSTDLAPEPAPTSPPSGFALRLFGVGVVVFLANAGLLVLQLVAGRLLSPFIGSSLETWTSVIAAFLAGIAVGNAVGGRIADRGASAGKLALYLALGGVAALWTIGLPVLLSSAGVHTALPLGPRIPLLAFVLCFPVAVLLSVLTPLAIRIGVPDVRRTGLVSGLVFGLSTLGCLLGNYVTGFVLIPELSVNQIVIATATLLFVTAAGVLGLSRATAEPAPERVPHPALPEPDAPSAALPLRLAFVVVFLCSFAGMTLELSATRLLAPVLGVSIYTWTGVIGVMLAGTCLGNWCGGWLADRGDTARTADDRKFTAAGCMLVAAAASVLVILLFSYLLKLEKAGRLDRFGLIEQVMFWTFCLFFLPMFLLGTISPQVIRLATPDVSRAGRTAGRVYAWSTAGAIAGTFATGYFLISTLGVLLTLLLTAVLPSVAAVLACNPRKQPRMLYALCAVGGILAGGGYMLFKAGRASDAESNYYTISVTGDRHLEYPKESTALGSVVGPAGITPLKRDLRWMNLDHLTHSIADLNDPTFLHYEHEQIQLEAVYSAASAHPSDQRVLVIGGGGYTFPRCVKTLVPTANVEVVEIDPMVTAIAIRLMGFDPKLATSHHMDGRQFVAERAKPGTYHVVTLDAVNDYSVPYHLLTKECNEAVKRTLTPDGVYLVTVIDEVYEGKLWKAAFHTLKESFPHVTMAFPKGLFDPQKPEAMGRAVIVLYASERPLDVADWSAARRKAAGRASDVYAVPDEIVQRMLAVEPKRIVLTDQYSPVDNLMMQVFQKAVGK
jgi:spermidine synthase/MFS family permease